jgi:hypothetical protein
MIFGSDISKFGNDIKKITTSLDDYNYSLNKAKYVQEAFDDEISGSNVGLKNYLSGLNGAEATMGGYVKSLVVARAKTIALQVATAALNAAISFGLSYALSLVVKQIDEWYHAEEKAAEAAKELRDSGHQSIEAMGEEINSLDSIMDRYLQLYTSTDDLVGIQKELSSMQGELISKYGEEAEGIDLVNGKLSEEIEKIRQLKKEKVEDYIFDTENQKRYKQAVESLEGTDKNARIADSDSTQFYRAKIKADTTTDLSNMLKLFHDTGVAFDHIATDMWGKEADIAVMGTLEEQVEGWKKIADTYKEIDGYDEDIYKGLMAQYVAARAKYEVDKADADQMERQTKYYNSFEVPQDVLDNYNSLIDKAKELNHVIAGDNTTIKKRQAAQSLDEIRQELNKIGADYPSLQQDVDSLFSSFETGASGAITAIESMSEAWYESYDELKKTTLKNIDAMKSALQTLANGNGIDRDAFMDLYKLDDELGTKYLSPASFDSISGQFKVTEQQLIDLKDAYIQKQIQSIELKQIELLNAKKAAQEEVASIRAEMNTWSEMRKNSHNPNYYQYVELQNQLETAEQKVVEIGEDWDRNNVVLQYYNGSLGDTVDRQQALNNLTKELNEEADTLLKAQEYKIDSVIEGYEAEKSAIEASKEAMEEQLTVLQEQKDALEEITENYEKVANTVQNAIKEQIEAIKEQNEEREEALDLAEKLANLENAKNKKVRTYTEAGGWQYEAKKSDIDKAQREVDKAQANQDIKVLEEYLKQWEGVTQKRQKAEDERLAEQILGADWRDKIAEQDLDILNDYETEYDKYADELSRVSNVEMVAVNKSIEASNKQIAAVDKEIKKWQEYKSKVQNVAKEAKDSVQDFYKEAYNISLSMGSDEGDMARNLDSFYKKYSTIISKLTQAQDELNESVAGMDYSSYDNRIDDIEKRLDRLEVDEYGIRRAIVKEDLSKYNQDVNSAWDAYLRKIGAYADGGVNTYTGLAMLHGTKQRPELVLNSTDAAKLYNALHNSPALTPSAITGNMRIAQNLGKKSDTANAVTFNGTVINLPNVQNAEQFARQMESYMQTVLTESQVFKPRR